MRRVLTSLCGILLIASLIYTTNNSEIITNHSGSASGMDTFFEGTILSLNILFLFVFLISILAIIKEEDKNEKKNNPLL
ncbi:MAG: hypothetical protein EOO92_16295 [Pedobacter sp.]|nr:MAG: hypothetical protein EOO92_16295 [Pedobacter sp.]